MKGFAYVAAAVIVVVGATVGAISLVGGWSSRSYASPAAVLRQIGCTAQEIQKVGATAVCPPQVNLGPVDYLAMTFNGGSSPITYLRSHEADFEGNEGGVVYGPNWLIAISTSEGNLPLQHVVKSTGGTIWLATTSGSDQRRKAAIRRAVLTLCQTEAQLDRLAVRRTNDNPQLNLHFPFPTVVIVTDADSVRNAVKALCALPRMPKGVFHCPADIGLDYHLTFSTSTRTFKSILVPATGCQEVGGLGPRRWIARTPSFWRVLGKAMGVANATYATFSDSCGYC